MLKSVVEQELCTLQQTLKTSENINSDDLTCQWNVTDPCSKQNCNCFRCKAKKNSNQTKSSNTNISSQNLSGVHKKGDKADKDKDKDKDKQQQKLVKNNMPFHRRSPVLDVVLDMNSSASLKSTDTNVVSHSLGTSSVVTNTSVNSNISQPTSVPTYSYKSPVGGGGLPSLQSNATTPTGANGFDSPRSAAPSILEGPVPSIGDQTNLSNSPHQSKEDATAAACIEFQMAASQSVSQSPMNNQRERTHLEQLLSPNHSLPSVKGSGAPNQPDDSSNLINSQSWTPGQSTSEIDNTNAQPLNETVNGFQVNNSNSHSQQTSSSMKRPYLEIHDQSDCDSFRNGLLYDYSYLTDLSNCWDIPPPKNRRRKNYSLNEFRRSNSINEMYLINRKRNSPGAMINCDLNEIKPKDPYEFSDFDEDGPSFKAVQNINEELLNGGLGIPFDCNTDMLVSNSSQFGKDTPKTNLLPSEISATSPQTRGFTREDELVPSYRDLDQIFESSGEDSTDEIFHAPSTPSGSGSNRVLNTNTIISGNNEDHSKSAKSTGTTGILGVAELTRMFPTPPSLEPMAPSPYNTGPDTAINDDLNGKNEIYPSSPILDSKVRSFHLIYISNILFIYHCNLGLVICI